MKKILYTAPFVKSRYQGGILKIAEFLSQENSQRLFGNKNIELELFNSHYLNQSKNSDGKFYWENLRQAFSFYSRLKRRIAKDDFALIHLNSSYGLPLIKDLLIISILRYKTAKPIIFQIHFCGVKETFSKINWIRKTQFYLMEKLKAIILLSTNFKDEMVSLGFPSQNLKVLYNFHPYLDEKTIDDFSNFKKLQLLFMGSIDNRKGILDLLEALVDINIEYELDVAGNFDSDEIEMKCKQIIDRNKLNVNFIGYVSGHEKDLLLKKAQILILPSYAEGFPMVIPEAMAYGCAILATSIAGIPEIVIEDKNGILFKPGDTKKIREGLEYLYNNKKVLIKYMSNSLAYSDKFNLPSYILNLSSIYENVISK